MQVEHLPALSLNIPEWFARADFQAWLNSPTGYHATWHAQGNEPSEVSDTFILFDNGDGSDFDELFPPELHALICEVCADRGLTYCLLRLTNLPV